MKKRAIVKVQLSLATSENRQQMLVYTEGGNDMFQCDAPKAIVKAMGGEHKRYFYALVPTKTAGKIVLLEEAPWQDW